MCFSGLRRGIKLYREYIKAAGCFKVVSTHLSYYNKAHPSPQTSRREIYNCEAEPRPPATHPVSSNAFQIKKSVPAKMEFN